MSELVNKLRTARERRRAALARADWDDQDEITERITGLATAAAVAAARASVHEDSEAPKARGWAKHAKSAGAVVGALVALAAAVHEVIDLVSTW